MILMETETHIMENALATAKRFEKAGFDYHGGYLTYGDDRRFAARGPPGERVHHATS